jgi:hypothetical protein
MDDPVGRKDTVSPAATRSAITFIMVNRVFTATGTESQRVSHKASTQVCAADTPFLSWLRPSADSVPGWPPAPGSTLRQATDNEGRPSDQLSTEAQLSTPAPRHDAQRRCPPIGLIPGAGGRPTSHFRPCTSERPVHAARAPGHVGPPTRRHPQPPPSDTVQANNPLAQLAHPATSAPPTRRHPQPKATHAPPSKHRPSKQPVPAARTPSHVGPRQYAGIRDRRPPEAAGAAEVPEQLVPPDLGNLPEDRLISGNSRRRSSSSSANTRVANHNLQPQPVQQAVSRPARQEAWPPRLR